jgi:hypothetical protein
MSDLRLGDRLDKRLPWLLKYERSHVKCGLLHQ